MTEEHRPESKGHVKVWTTAKGEPQWEVKVVAGEDAALIANARLTAVAQFRLLKGELA